MSIRKDEAQLIITIDAKESVAYQKSVSESAQLIKNIKSAEVGTKEYNNALTAQKRISDELAKTDYNKLSLKNLQDRRKQLIELQRQLPQNVFAEQGFSRELQQVNNAMKQAVDRTRATTNALEGLSKSGFWSNIKTNILSIAGGFAIFEVAKRAISGLINVGKESLELFDKQAKADAQLKAAIKSTNGAAGRSFEQLKEQASALQQITLFGDEQTQQAQALLLTFTNVREEIFDRSIPAIQDYATAMGSDLKSASVQVGKALNDPIKGVTALGKAGVQFSEDQKSMIASLVESGDLAGAQTIILKELETQFKGSAEAAAKAGLGPYQQLSNRIGDVKDQFGLLVERGLKFALPFIEKVTVFIEKFVNTLVNGEKATGDMSGAVNFLVGVLKLLYNGFGIIKDIISAVITRFSSLFKIISDIPILGSGVKLLINVFKSLSDVVSNTAAVFAGLRAAIQQTFDNASNYIKTTLLTLQIFAKEAELLLSFKDDTKNRLKNEIKQLESLKADASKAGKTVGEAYRDAYTKQLTDEALAAKILKENSAKEAADRVGTRTIGDTEGETDESTSKKKKERREKEAKEEKTDYQKLLKERLELIDENFRKEQQIAEKNFLEGNITKDEYEKIALEQKRISLGNQLNLLKLLGQAETEEFRKKELEKIKIEQELEKQRQELSDQRIKERLELLQENAAQELRDNEVKFLEGLITEEEREQMRLEILRNTLNERLALLEAAGLQETDAYKKLIDEKIAADLDQKKKLEENEKRHQEIKKQLQELGNQTLSDSISFAIDLLGEDEQARKKNAGLIKAFETARVVISAQAEIADIFKSTAGLGPFGWALAGARAFLVGARSIAAISKIQSTKFALGGSLKDGMMFRGPKHSAGGIKLPTGDEVEGDEIIINARSSRAFLPQLNAINTYNGWGRRLFNLGGSINPNVTPSGIQGVPLSPAGSGQGIDAGMIRMFSDAVDKFVSVLPVALNNIRAIVVYSDIVEAGTAVNDVERASRF